MGVNREKYFELYNLLNFNALTVTFIKKNGEPRVILATRDSDIAKLFCGNPVSLLSSREGKASVNNGNIACIDCIIGEVRMFNVDRVLHYYNHGDITVENKENIIKDHLDYLEAYIEKYKQSVDDLSILDM